MCAKKATVWITYDWSPDGYTVACDEHAPEMATWEGGALQMEPYGNPPEEPCCFFVGADEVSRP